MSRVKRGVTTKKTHKNLFAKTKGYRHGRKNLVRMANQAILKAGQYAYTHRRTKKRDFRALWIIQINAACRLNGITYSVFMKALKDNKIELDRKVLSQMAEQNSAEFTALVEKVKIVKA
jgi:large subunit ribosomal protein L20